MSRSYSLLVALCLAVFATPCQALSFQFSFTNLVAGSGTALVEGIISGLDDNAPDQAATSVVVTANGLAANGDGFGLGEYVGNPNINQFTVSGGIITQGFFTAFGDFNTLPDVTCCSLVLDFLNVPAQAGLTQSPDRTSSDPDAGLRFTSVSEVPLPAALPMLASGLGALGLFAWRRRKRAAAVAAA